MPHIERLTPRSLIVNPDGAPSGYFIGRDQKMLAKLEALEGFANVNANLAGGATLADTITMINGILDAVRTT